MQTLGNLLLTIIMKITSLKKERKIFVTSHNFISRTETSLNVIFTTRVSARVNYAVLALPE